MQKERIQSDGVSLSLRRYGLQAKPTVVLVHGYPDNSSVWDGVVARLAQQFQVVTYDVRGAGESSAPANSQQFRLEQLSSDLSAVIDHVSPDQPVHLVGHDWGSIQSWESVCDPLLAKRIRSFTSMSGPSLDHAGQWLRQIIRDRQLGIVGKQVAKSWYMSAFQLPWLAPAVWRLGLDQLWPGILQRLEELEAPVFNASQRDDGLRGIELYRANVLRRLQNPKATSCRVPVQLLVATEDPFISKELIDALPQWIPLLWRRDIAAGHWLPLSEPEWVAECVTEFIEYHETGVETNPLALAKTSSNNVGVANIEPEYAA